MNIGTTFRRDLSHFMDDTINKMVFRVSILSMFVLFSSAVFFWSRLPPQLPLYYSLPWGEEQIGTPTELILVLTGAALLFLLNTFLAVILKSNQPFFSRILFLGGAGVVLLTIITVVQIMLLVT